MKSVVIYTDGACSGNPGTGGYGVVMLYKEMRKELSAGYQLTTNNRMEMMAVIEGLKALKAPCHVDLYSDSKYVIDSIEKEWVYKWRKQDWRKSDKSKALNVDLWIMLLELLEFHEVKLHWVKGHANIPENERCDQLARDAIGNISLLEDVGYQP